MNPIVRIGFRTAALIAITTVEARSKPHRPKQELADIADHAAKRMA